MIHVSGQNLLPKAKRAFILSKIKQIEVSAETSVVFVSDLEIQRLNKQWRQKNKPTDVLSFPAEVEGISGDIVISVERAKAQAVEWGHDLPEEILVLVVHGLMHLRGYDHEKSRVEAKKQTMAEMALLGKIGVNPKLALCGRAEKNNFKMTRPRELIVAELIKQNTHISVEQILNFMRKKNSQVSQATVYRTLKLLQESGLVKTHYFNDTQALYEINLEPEEHHDHLICEVCQKIVEFVNPEIERLQEWVAKQQGFRLTRHRMELYGICPNCE